MIKKIVLSISCLIIFLGCQKRMDIENNKFSHKVIANNFKITELKDRINANGFMEVEVEGNTNSSNYKRLEYSIMWYDKDQFKIESNQNNKWRSFKVFLNQEFVFSAISPNTKAIDFKIFIRDEKKTGKYLYYSEEEEMYYEFE